MRLVPSTVALVRAEIDDHDELGRLLDARIPPDWPPGEAAEALPWFAAELEAADEAGIGWYGFYGIVADGEPESPVLVGGAGGLGPPRDGEVEIGYSLLPAFQRRGYATEMLTAILKWLARDPRVMRIVAETDYANGPSRRLLGRLGFEPIGAGREPSSLRFARDIAPGQS